MTHNHNTRAKALVSGGCVISGEINFDYRTFFSKQWCIIPLQTSMISKIKYKACMFRVHKSWGKGNGGRVTGKKF